MHIFKLFFLYLSIFFFFFFFLSIPPNTKYVVKKNAREKAGIGTMWNRLLPSYCKWLTFWTVLLAFYRYLLKLAEIKNSFLYLHHKPFLIHVYVHVLRSTFILGEST